MASDVVISPMRGEPSPWNGWSLLASIRAWRKWPPRLVGGLWVALWFTFLLGCSSRNSMEADVQPDIPADGLGVDLDRAEDIPGADVQPDILADGLGVDLDRAEDIPGVEVALSSMVHVPEGAFWMGCNDTIDSLCKEWEFPYHEVHLEDYEIDVTEVTRSQYSKCLVAGECQAPWCDEEAVCALEDREDPDGPVAWVTWEHAHVYCQWAGKRLCSEAEWEKAASGGCELYGDTSCGADKPLYPWGNMPPSCEFAVVNDGGAGCGKGGPWSVGSKSAGASPYGVLDMAGNVLEWTLDCFYDYSIAPDGMPTEDECMWWDGPYPGRSVRGGSFDAPLEKGWGRNSSRVDMPGVFTHRAVGFRCCRSL